MTTHAPLGSDLTAPIITFRMLRGHEGWPQELRVCDDAVMGWLVELALLDPNPWNQVTLADRGRYVPRLLGNYTCPHTLQTLLVYDLMVCGGDMALGHVRFHKQAVAQGLLETSQTSCGQVPPSQAFLWAECQAVAVLSLINSLCSW